MNYYDLDPVGTMRALIARLAPHEPLNDDEQGGCIWCGGHQPYGLYAGRNPRDHDPECPWLEADQLHLTGPA